MVRTCIDCRQELATKSGQRICGKCKHRRNRKAYGQVVGREWFDEMKLEETGGMSTEAIAAELGITKTRVRQIVNKGLRKLRARAAHLR